jgi:hypothetical protein
MLPDKLASFCVLLSLTLGAVGSSLGQIIVPETSTRIGPSQVPFGNSTRSPGASIGHPSTQELMQRAQQRHLEAQRRLQEKIEEMRRRTGVGDSADNPYDSRISGGYFDQGEMPLTDPASSQFDSAGFGKSGRVPSSSTSSSKITAGPIIVLVVLLGIVLAAIFGLIALVIVIILLSKRSVSNPDAAQAANESAQAPK